MKIKALFFLAFSYLPFAAKAQIYTLDFGKKIQPLGFFKQGKQFILVSDTAVFQFDKKEKIWKPFRLFSKKVTSAALVKDRIWMGNDNYFFSMNDKNELSFWRGIKNGNIEILSLKTNQNGQELVVGTAEDGAFTMQDSAITKDLVKYIRAEDACTCGNFYWVGTNIGLMRIDKNGNLQTYAEEGVKGFEIPDNIVERLYCADNKHLLIIMSNQLAFLEVNGDESATHAEGFSYLGSKKNTLFQQLVTPQGDFLFLTQEGLLLMKVDALEKMHVHGASTEVYSSNRNPSVVKITNELLKEKVWYAGYFDEKQNLWLATDRNTMMLPKKEWAELMGVKK